MSKKTNLTKRPVTARHAAAEVLQSLFKGRGSLDTLWPAMADRLQEPREQAFARELTSGTLRWFERLQFLLDQLTERSPKDQLVRAVLLTGLYQLSKMRVAEHAAISESVETVRKLGRPRAAGLVNAVLRRYQREAAALEAQADQHPATRHACPQWLYDQLYSDWPDDCEAVLAASNERAPMWLRVNSRRTDLDTYTDMLAAGGKTEVMRHPYASQACAPSVPVPVTALPGFADGLVTVQDAGAQLAAPLLDLQPGMRVLDACAAPGGKSGHILELADVELTAVDNDAKRLQRLVDNLQRLGHNATVQLADASAPEQWWDGKLFDRILLDVPCSATGVIRRHPDIKLLRRRSDLAALEARQTRLLQRCWSMLAPGGRLVYATCSLLKQENSAIVEAFLRSAANALQVTPSIAPANTPDWGREADPGRQIMTGEAGMDGFYYSCLEHT